MRNLTGVILLFLVLQGCDNQEKDLTDLPTSTGTVDEVLVVADKNLLESDLREPARLSFMAGYEVLPQYEATMPTTMVGFRDFTQLFQRFRNVVFYVDLSDNTKISDYVADMLGEEATLKALSDNDFYFVAKKNIWATPQLVIFVFAPNSEKLLDIINNRNERVIQIIQDSEKPFAQKLAYAGGKNYDLTQKVGEKYGLQFDLPAGFQKAIEEDEFMWLRKDGVVKGSDTYTNLMIEQLPISGDENWWTEGRTWRDTLGKKYITTEIEGSYMLSDTILPFTQMQITMEGMPVYITKGLWKMDGAFMGGPFINYVIVDEAKGTKTIIDGFIYAAGTKKKPLARQLEAIMSGFEANSQGS